MAIPEGVEVFMYGNQKLNIWEFQKEQMRKQIANDPKHFYSYSKDFLSLAFPIVNEHEIRLKEKEDSESRWKTKNGFDNLIKNNNFNEHPKKPPQSVLDDLQIPYVEQMRERLATLKAAPPFSTEEGKPGFYTNFRCQQTFSEPAFFKTVFISGDDMVKEMQEAREKEVEDWKKKVVVENEHFTVNTRQPKHQAQVDKNRTMLEDPVKKFGLRLSQSKFKHLAERQILATKTLESVPPSMFTYLEFVDPLKTTKKLKEKDVTKMPDGKDFNTNIKNDVLSRSPLSKKRFIQPVNPVEKDGPKWYHHE